MLREKEARYVHGAAAVQSGQAGQDEVVSNSGG
jgi:hypothetical protein